MRPELFPPPLASEDTVPSTKDPSRTRIEVSSVSEGWQISKDLPAQLHVGAIRGGVPGSPVNERQLPQSLLGALDTTAGQSVSHLESAH